MNKPDSITAILDSANPFTHMVMVTKNEQNQPVDAMLRLQFLDNSILILKFTKDTPCKTHKMMNSGESCHNETTASKLSIHFDNIPHKIFNRHNFYGEFDGFDITLQYQEDETEFWFSIHNNLALTYDSTPV